MKRLFARSSWKRLNYDCPLIICTGLIKVCSMITFLSISFWSVFLMNCLFNLHAESLIVGFGGDMFCSRTFFLYIRCCYKLAGNWQVFSKKLLLFHLSFDYSDVMTWMMKTSNTSSNLSPIIEFKNKFCFSTRFLRQIS